MYCSDFSKHTMRNTYSKNILYVAKSQVTFIDLCSLVVVLIYFDAVLVLAQNNQ